MGSRLIATIWKIGLFSIVFLLNLAIVAKFYNEQNKSLEMVSRAPYKKIASEMLRDANTSPGRNGDLGKDIARVKLELADLVKTGDKLPAPLFSKKLEDEVEYVRMSGGSADIVDKYTKELARGASVRSILNWGDKLGLVIYILIFYLAAYAAIYILFLGQAGRTKQLNNILEAFDRSLAGASLAPSIDPLNYYRMRVEELHNKSIGQSVSYINHLSALGLLGTLFGLTLAFYTAASAFPEDLKQAFADNESQTIVVGGLIQCIYNYSFAVITALVAYSQAICLRLLRGLSPVDVLGEFDRRAELALSRVDGSINTGATERAIVNYVREIASRSDIDTRLKSVLGDLSIYVDSARRTVEADIENFKKSISESSKGFNESLGIVKKSVSEAAESSEAMNVRLKAYQMLLEQLRESSTILNSKVDGIIKAMK